MWHRQFVYGTKEYREKVDIQILREKIWHIGMVEKKTVKWFKK